MNMQTRRARTATVSPSQSAGPALLWLHPQPTHPATVLDAPYPITVGRDPSCTTALTGTEISRVHAEIACDGDTLVVRDRGSTNGTFVDGRRVESAPLHPGSVLRVGEWIGLVAPEPPALAGRFEEILPGFYAGPRTLAALGPVRRSATSDLPVVIEGETGTGKERVASALHQWSGRIGPLVAVNCGAVPVTLAESELFGHRKGAFTGADRARAGHFRTASGGTLMLDEVVDLPAMVQVKLLRVLEERQVTPLGESQPVPIDVRIVCAAQMPLEDAVRQRGFRADLRARLTGVTVSLPPLRERREEIPFLFLKLLDAHAGGRAPQVEPAFIEALVLYDWPLNVRELELLARRVLVLHGLEASLSVEHLPEHMRQRAPGAASAAPVRFIPPMEHRGDALLDLLKVHRGNVARAAAALGISRQAAYRLIEGRGLGATELGEFRQGARPRSSGGRRP